MTEVPDHRVCPHCKKGLGTCQGTERVSETLKRRRYQCAACDKWWTVDVREAVSGKRWEVIEERT